MMMMMTMMTMRVRMRMRMGGMMFRQTIRSGAPLGQVAIAKFTGLRDGCFLKMGDPE